MDSDGNILTDLLPIAAEYGATVHYDGGVELRVQPPSMNAAVRITHHLHLAGYFLALDDLCPGWSICSCDTGAGGFYFLAMERGAEALAEYERRRDEGRL